VNEGIRSRVTYSAELPALSNAGIAEIIYEPLDRVGLAHTTFSEAAVTLVGRSSEGVLRCVKNLCARAIIEAVRDQVRVMNTKPAFQEPTAGRQTERSAAPKGVSAANQIIKTEGDGVNPTAETQEA